MPVLSLPLFIVALAGAVAALACGGSDDTAGSDSPTATAALTSTTTAEPTAPSEATAPATAVPTTGAGLPGELQRLAARAETLTHTATYTVEIAGMKGTLTIAQAPPKRYVAVQTPALSYAFISDGTTLVTCTGGALGGTCTRVDSAPGEIIDPSALVDQIAPDKSIVKREDRTIAGIESACWSTEMSGLGAETVVCVAKSLPVLTLVEGMGLKMELESFSQSADPALFEPPYPVRQ